MVSNFKLACQYIFKNSVCSFRLAAVIESKHHQTLLLGVHCYNLCSHSVDSSKSASAEPSKVRPEGCVSSTPERECNVSQLHSGDREYRLMCWRLKGCQHALQKHHVLVMGASHCSAPCLYGCNGDTGVTNDRYWFMSLAYLSHLTVSIFKVHPLLWASPQSSMSITVVQSLSQTSSSRSGNLFSSRFLTSRAHVFLYTVTMIIFPHQGG